MKQHKAVVADGLSVPRGALLLWPGQNLRTGEVDFAEAFGEITTLESDALRLATSIYACDLAFKRGEREEIVRTIELEIPVVNYQVLKSLKDEIEIALWNLSDDNWTVRFRRAGGSYEPARAWPANKGKTILFSGGLDSFAGAVEILEQSSPEAVHLASHVTGNQITRQSQNDLYEYLCSSLGKPRWTAVRTGGRKSAQADFPADQEREDSQRTRSFMFLTIAALAARRSGHHEIVMIAENGQMAIHLPLSPARTGAFSTHTAHPEFVARMAKILSDLLDVQFSVENPYLYMTKAEVVARIAHKHKAALASAVSCWRSARPGSSRHCGECVPCLIRRIALEKNDISLNEYARNLLAENIADLPETDSGKRNLVELIQLAHSFASNPDATLEQEFPDLINQDIDLDQAIGMYRRFAIEASDVLARYRGVAGLMSGA